MHELQIILENIRNQLTVIKGFAQLQKESNPLMEELIYNPVNNADALTKEAMQIIKLSRML